MAKKSKNDYLRKGQICYFDIFLGPKITISEMVTDVAKPTQIWDQKGYNMYENFIIFHFFFKYAKIGVFAIFSARKILSQKQLQIE